MSTRRHLPAVETVLQALGPVSLPRPWIVKTVRETLTTWRRANNPAGLAEVLTEVRVRLAALRRARLQPVINGTGILLHTNLGRAPLLPAAVEALCAVGGGYANLELDLGSGERGQRGDYLERSLALLAEAEAATVVNNCAAALVLILRHFTRGTRKEVVVSRGELIQIGGGFRIPEILEASGARLREVGTTNRTTVDDYANAIGAETALLLKVHRSNFRLSGFVESAALPELAALARRKRIPLVEDLGSGAFLPTENLGDLGHEPTPAESLRAGVDLVCCSGDKLLGGPQAGLILGRQKMVAALKREPFFRALRCDKLVFAALQATVEAHLTRRKDDPSAGLPVLNMLTFPIEVLRSRAEAIRLRCEGSPARIAIGVGRSEVGGGTLPGVTVASVTLDLQPHTLGVEELAARLRHGTPPVIGCLSGKRFKLDLRTVFPEQDTMLAAALREALDGDR